MATEKKSEREILSPMRITDKKGIIGPAGNVYELDFDRESAIFATRKGIDVEEENTSVRLVNAGLLFFCAFRKNHRNISREKTDKLLKENHGISSDAFNYLYNLLAQALLTNTIILDEDEKNVAMDVEMD